MNVMFYLLNVVFSSGQSSLGKCFAAKGGSSAVFNINKAVAGILVFLVTGLIFGISFHLPTLMFSVGYGIFLCISMYAGFNALAIGSMALTSIIASFSLIIPFIFGITVWGEKMTAFGLIGMLFLIAAIILLNLKKEGGISLKWSFLAFLTLISNGVCSLIQKYHQIYYTGYYRTEFMLFSLITVLCILVIREICKKEKGQFSFSLLGLVSGLMNGGANYIVLYLAATQNASVLFPVVSVTNVIAVWFIGKFFFKEDLKKIQILGLLFGVTAIILLNIKQ